MKRYAQNPKNRAQRRLLLRRERTRKRKGDFLIEGTIALFLLVSLAFLLLQSSITILRPRSETIAHNMADAYLTFETALANRVGFAAISNSGQWPLYPAFSQTQVNLGTMPQSGRVVTGDVRRTRMAYNWAPTGGGAIDFDDLGIEVWKLQSHLVYTINGTQFVKSRTVVRSQ